VNPNAFTGTNSIYTPTLGDVFPLITSSGNAFPAADFNDSGVVDAADLTVWKGAFGTSPAGDANDDGVTDGSDFLIWQQSLGLSSGIAGSFDALVVEDPTNVMAGFGLAFQLQTTSNAVNLVVVAASSLAAVPEPSAAMLAGGAMLAFAYRRRVSSGG
jgi:hypothetical protein